MIQELSLGNVCANGVLPLTTYAWGTDFIDALSTEASVFEFEADGEPYEADGPTHYIDGGGGILRLVSGDGSLSVISAKTKEFVLPALNKRYFFKARVRLDDATNCSFIAGLAAYTTDPANVVANGVWFGKDSGDAYLDISVRKDAVDGTTGATATALHTMVSDTWVDIAFEVLTNESGKCQLWAWVDGKVVLNGVNYTANCPTTDMGIVFAVQSSAQGGYKPMDIDYVAAGSER